MVVKSVVPAARRAHTVRVHDRFVGRTDQPRGQITLNRATDGHVLHLRGDVDGPVVDEFTVGQRLDDVQVIAVDVAELEYIDSTGLAFLVQWAKDCRTDGRPAEIRQTTQRFDRVLEIAGLTSVFERL